jgi:diacylglycerol O-acyltransferase / wax synthase
MYLCGARLTYFSAILPITDGMGLVFAVTSYDGRLNISPTSCRELMPDPAQFALDLRESFQELWALLASGATGKTASGETAPGKTAPSKRSGAVKAPLPPAAAPRRSRASSSGRSSRAAPSA